MSDLRERVKAEIDGLMDNARYDCATNRAVAVDRIRALLSPREEEPKGILLPNFNNPICPDPSAHDRPASADALRPYVEHKRSCRVNEDPSGCTAGPCTCGLEAALHVAAMAARFIVDVCDRPSPPRDGEEKI